MGPLMFCEVGTDSADCARPKVLRVAFAVVQEVPAGPVGVRTFRAATVETDADRVAELLQRAGCVAGIKT